MASADRRFAALADLDRPEVLAWEQQPIARRLQEAAHELRRVSRPGATAAESPAAADLQVKESRATAPAAPARPDRRSAEFVHSALIRGVRRVGMALGQRLIDLLLAQPSNRRP